MRYAVANLERYARERFRYRGQPTPLRFAESRKQTRDTRRFAAAGNDPGGHLEPLDALAYPSAHRRCSSALISRASIRF